MKKETKQTRRLWVGVKGNARTVFRHTGEPTAETCPQFTCAVGPFRTKRGAEYLAKRGGNGNPHCQSVREAERLAAGFLWDMTVRKWIKKSSPTT
jgi:hypothetical protein